MLYEEGLLMARKKFKGRGQGELFAREATRSARERSRYRGKDMAKQIADLLRRRDAGEGYRTPRGIGS